MLKIKCPKCGEFDGIFCQSFWVGCNLKRKCVACGEDFELSNSIVVGAIVGLLFGGIMNILLYWNIHLLLRFAVVFLMMIFVPIVALRILGRWRICEGDK